jgi:Domain of unknown function (DUF4112)
MATTHSQFRAVTHDARKGSGQKSRLLPSELKGPQAAFSRGLQRYTVIANLLDQAFRIPGTNFRFGIDPLLGLVPGAGDLATALLGLYGVLVARQLGAPRVIQGRMLLNLGIDALAGTVPVIGDLFDFGFKAHVRNRVLLEKWLLRNGGRAG